MQSNKEHLTDIISYIPSIKIPVDKIILDPSNPNKMTDQQILGLEKFMKKHGFAVELWVNQNKDNTYLCIDGEHRVKVLQKNNIKSVYAKIFHVKPHEVKMMRQIANKLHGIHDKNKDAMEYKEIFDAGELDELADILDESVEDFENILEKNFDVSFEREETEELPEIPAELKSKLGDIYQLNSHRIMCGDCTINEDVQKLLGNNKINMIFTDPPYGVKYSQTKHQIKAPKNLFHAIKNDDKQGIDLYNFILTAFTIIKEYYDSVSVYVCTQILQESFYMLQALLDAGLKINNRIVWVKDNFVLCRTDYQMKHEDIWHGYAGKSHYWCGSRSESDIWEIARDWNNSYQHPTQKPVKLPLKAIKNSSRKGDIIYDPFLGSGSTLLAAEQTDRICFGMELEPSYVDVCVQRWENYTGKKAKKL